MLRAPERLRGAAGLPLAGWPADAPVEHRRVLAGLEVGIAPPPHAPDDEPDDDHPNHDPDHGPEPTTLSARHGAEVRHVPAGFDFMDCAVGRSSLPVDGSV